MLPVNLLDPRLLFLPAALEVQASHKCLRHPVKQQQGFRYSSYYWDLGKKTALSYRQSFNLNRFKCTAQRWCILYFQIDLIWVTATHGGFADMSWKANVAKYVPQDWAGNTAESSCSLASCVASPALLSAQGGLRFRFVLEVPGDSNTKNITQQRCINQCGPAQPPFPLGLSLNNVPPTNSAGHPSSRLKMQFHHWSKKMT